MHRPPPMTRDFIVKRLLDAHGFVDLDNTNVEAVWAIDWEAVQLTIKETNRQLLWWPVSIETAVAAHQDALHCLRLIPLPDEIRKPS